MAEPEEMYQCQTVNCGYIYNPDKGDRKGKYPKGPSLTICRTTGNVRCAVLERKCLNPLPDPVQFYPVVRIKP